MNNRTARQLSSRKLAAAVLTISFFIAAILLLRRFDPAEYSFYPKCTLYQVTGLHCPGCGATRAVGALAAGRLGDAIRYNPLLILGGPIIAAVIAIKVRREDQGEASWTVFSVCIVIVVISFAIARNVPSPTRSILAPPSKIVPEESSAGENKVPAFFLNTMLSSRRS